MSGWPTILAAILAQPTWHGDLAETPEQRADLLRPVAMAIELATEDTSERAALIALGYAESSWARAVVEGRCADMPAGVRCDNGRARSPWQLWASSCPSAWALAEDDPRALERSAACAVRLLRGARGALPRWVERSIRRIRPRSVLHLGTGGGEGGDDGRGADEVGGGAMTDGGHYALPDVLMAFWHVLAIDARADGDFDTADVFNQHILAGECRGYWSPGGRVSYVRRDGAVTRDLDADESRLRACCAGRRREMGR